MTPEEFADLQQKLGLSDTKLGRALGVTRQTIRNWKCGSTCPQFAQNAIRWMIELRRLDPANDNLPQGVRVHL
jgi:DNA-binding transcriptional regulator YiaG